MAKPKTGAEAETLERLVIQRDAARATLSSRQRRIEELERLLAAKGQDHPPEPVRTLHPPLASLTGLWTGVDRAPEHSLARLLRVDEAISCPPGGLPAPTSSADTSQDERMKADSLEFPYRTSDPDSKSSEVDHRSTLPSTAVREKTIDLSHDVPRQSESATISPARAIVPLPVVKTALPFATPSKRQIKAPGIASVAERRKAPLSEEADSDSDVSSDVGGSTSSTAVQSVTPVVSSVPAPRATARPKPRVKQQAKKSCGGQ